MTKIIVTVAATNEALRASLREPSTKSFKASGRGLLAACAWGADMRATLKQSLGNLSYPRVTMEIDGVEVDFDWVSMDLFDEDAGRNTVKRAEAALAANYPV